MPLTKEELLRPRIKVIADYPDSQYDVGDILNFEQWGGDLKKWANYNDDGRFVEFLDYFNGYPHLFQPLPWWSDRNPEDMPEYVREVDSLYKIGEVIKVKEWVLENEETDCPCFQDERDNHFTWVRGFEPATKSEHTAYINQKQQ